MSEALENQGFNPKGVGSEVPKSARVQHAVQCVPSMRAPQLFSVSHPAAPVGAAGEARGQFERPGGSSSSGPGDLGAMSG
eukprot:1943181-Alexandrium_andersonii.AAC.1